MYLAWEYVFSFYNCPLGCNLAMELIKSASGKVRVEIKNVKRNDDDKPYLEAKWHSEYVGFFEYRRIKKSRNQVSLADNDREIALTETTNT